MFKTKVVVKLHNDPLLRKSTKFELSFVWFRVFIWPTKTKMKSAVHILKYIRISKKYFQQSQI